MKATEYKKFCSRKLVQDVSLTFEDTFKLTPQQIEEYSYQLRRNIMHKRQHNEYKGDLMLTEQKKWLCPKCKKVPILYMEKWDGEHVDFERTQTGIPEDGIKYDGIPVQLLL